MARVSKPDSSQAKPPRHDRRRERLVSYTKDLLPEIAALVAMGMVGWVTYAYVTSEALSQSLLHPTAIAAIMVLNLVPAMALIVLVGSRIARARATRSLVGGHGRLHVRLVVIFSIIAAMSTFVVVIFASLLFQMGVSFWFSDQSRGMFENAADLAEGYYQENQQEVEANSIAMAHDISDALQQMSFDSRDFVLYYFQQVVIRNLNRSEIIEVGDDGVARRIAMVDPADPAEERAIADDIIERLNSGEQVITNRQGNRIESVTKLDVGRNVYLFASRDEQAMNLGQLNRANIILEDYNALFNRSRQLQLQFNRSLYIGSLVLVILAVAAGILLADRLVRPLGLLIGAAHTAAGGDLSVRVDVAERRDEIAVLSSAFNSMTERLQAQTNELVEANQQLERRRAFIETVLGGVSSAIISLDSKRRIQLANHAAMEITGLSQAQLVGRTIDTAIPALAEVIDSPHLKTVVSLEVNSEKDTERGSLGDSRGGSRSDSKRDIERVERGERTITVATKAVALHDGGYVLSFDDITQQLRDQRHAAWSEVARRIAHEIKNPLTPIQLAAERLQNRFADKIAADTTADNASVFQKLTDNIIGHVNEMRRMLDEFSSFARMPKPIFHHENLLDIVRRTALLFQVARPDIDFTIDSDAPDYPMICDRQLLSQAFTNIIKNSIEAIDERCAREDSNRTAHSDSDGSVHITLSHKAQDSAGKAARGGKHSHSDAIAVTIVDNGIGFPTDREAIVEPYMTTRQGGTGLGLAIVKKITDEHLGQIEFADVAGGGSAISFTFYPQRLQQYAPENNPDIKPLDADVPGRIRNRTPNRTPRKPKRKSTIGEAQKSHA